MGLIKAAELSGRLFRGDEARDGTTAFLEKRPPPWAPM
jgi:1,4-dihydroxy-2-naphthoyl-CoA synthase